MMTSTDLTPSSRLGAHSPRVIWQAQPGSQEAFLSCPVYEALYEGNRGGGKTDALIMSFAQYVGRGFGASWRGILFRQTYKQLVDVIEKCNMWFPQIFPEARYNGTEHKWKWPTGETLFLRQFMHDKDYYNYHGHEYPWIGWEELCNWPSYNGYKLMQSTCRSSRKGMPRMIRATTNPYGPGHNWVKHRWRLSGIPPLGPSPIIKDAVDDEGNPEPHRVSIHSSLEENLVLMEADPGYQDRILAAARNDAERKAWRDGSWDIVAGGMFDDLWIPSVHVVEPFPLPPNWRLDRSFDWGSSKPFAVGWNAESDGSDVSLADGTIISTVRGDLYRIAEWYGWNNKPNEGNRMLAVDIAEGIIEREVSWGWYGRVKSGPADTSIFDVENGKSIAIDMAQPVRLASGKKYRGVHWTRADKSPGSRKTGWEQMRRALAAAVRKDGRPREHPGLFIFNNCVHFLRTVPVLPRSDKDLDDINTEAEDHIADEIRYRIRARGNRIGSGKTSGMF